MEVKPKVTASAQARLEIAEEKARIMEEKLVTALSELEQAAQKGAENEKGWKHGFKN